MDKGSFHTRKIWNITDSNIIAIKLVKPLHLLIITTPFSFKPEIVSAEMNVLKIFII